MPSPRAAAFLSDFTLGFSDGLTVPFALTAGLSSLGRTDTVIYAGLAEVCAGCISMGIGGYLSARDAARAERRPDSDEERRMLASSRDRDDGWQEMAEKRIKDSSQYQRSASLRRRLADLSLPAETISAVMEAVVTEMRPQYNDDDSDDATTNEEYQRREQPSQTNGELQAAIFSGLAISLGYIVGGLLPLLPYCFAGNVGDGLSWSIIVCLFALFTYGALKDRVLGGSGSDMWRSLREGLQMAVLGSLAAGAAVACVHLVNQQAPESG